MSTFAAPVIATAGSGELTDTTRRLVVLLHGRGSNERDIIGLAGHLPHTAAYVAVRAPIAEGGGFAWFANRGVGRPVAASLRDTMDWFCGWLATVAPPGRPVVLVGFSGGAAFAGGLVLDNPARFAGAAILFGTLPFDAGVPVTAGRLAGLPVFVAHGEQDTVIPRELLDGTWAYLTGESEAVVLARTDPGGHGIGPDTLAGLADWLRQGLADRPSTPPAEAGSTGRWLALAEVPRVQVEVGGRGGTAYERLSRCNDAILIPPATSGPPSTSSWTTSGRPCSRRPRGSAPAR